MRAIISGVGHYVPDKILSNSDLEKMVDTDDEWIITRTGIKERRILDKEKGTSYMATRAAKIVLEETNTPPRRTGLNFICNGDTGYAGTLGGFFCSKRSGGQQ